MYNNNIYRSPTGNFNYFLQNLDKVLQLVYTPALHIIICGDININYLAENEQKRQIDNLLIAMRLPTDATLCCVLYLFPLFTQPTK